MLSFLKILARNVARGPAVEPLDAPDSAPEGFRGRIRYDAAACVACRSCEHVCAGGAIQLQERDDGVDLLLWHNSCVFCGMCADHCRTGALAVTRDWHLAHGQERKYHLVERGFVPLTACAGCGGRFVAPPAALLEVAFRAPSADTRRLASRCPSCRAIESAAGAIR